MIMANMSRGLIEEVGSFMLEVNFTSCLVRLIEDSALREGSRIVLLLSIGRRRFGWPRRLVGLMRWIGLRWGVGNVLIEHGHAEGGYDSLGGSSSVFLHAELKDSVLVIRVVSASEKFFFFFSFYFILLRVGIDSGY